MAEFKLTGDVIGCMATFHKVTKANPKDCIIYDDSITFVVGKEEMGLAIGKNGMNIKKASRALNKEVEVIEYTEDPVKFIKNAMYPIRPKTINIEEKNSKTVAKISVNKRDRALAIGSKGKNIHRLKEIVTRHHDVDDVVIV